MLRKKEGEIVSTPGDIKLRTAEKLPYAKPELHHLNLEGTEGKTTYSVKEGTTLGGTTATGPS